ncbi:putative transcription factor OFP family [Medicago truncatula]|uniref:Transcription repressor n=1 Tax=Medicago truncatula TaxID=3880 RepID=G7ZUW4_MEDTR|nr:transcription repressor OFP13 [Medicago truncatula]AFK37360.1 unknown [Medicago truncatula]KEH24200.1 ovate transcriptional repressor [Medicago truncatula]RHN48750.1 putative transcription factor OFP family [Medicago truncatula]
MGKKKTLNISSLLKNTELKYSSSSSSWPWPYCHQPKTLSFRADNINKDDTFKTINSVYLDASESFSTVSPNCDSSFSKASNDQESKQVDSIETVIRGLSSDRFFFEPDETNSILEVNNKAAAIGGGETQSLPFKDSVVLSMESRDPYVDFRKSMEEIVEAHDVKDWEGLQELLSWYLKVNEKINHGYIVGAFVDLLVGLTFASTSSSFSTSSSSSSRSPSSPLSFYSSSLSSSYSTRCVSCSEAREEEVDTPSSSLLLEQVREEIDCEDEVEASQTQASTSSSSSST